MAGLAFARGVDCMLLEGGATVDGLAMNALLNKVRISALSERQRAT